MIDKDAKTTFLEGKGRKGKGREGGTSREGGFGEPNQHCIQSSNLYFILCSKQREKGGGCHLERQQFLKA